MAKHACYWLESSGGNAAVSTSIGLPKRVDTVIIGGGIAGLSALYHFISGGAASNVILLESDFPGYHASGRCNGQSSFADKLDYMSKLSDETAFKYFDLMRDSQKYFETVVYSEELNCDHKMDGGVYVATSAESLQRYKDFAQRVEDLGIPIPIEILTQKEARSFVGSSSVVGGMYIPTESSLNPFKLMKSLTQLLDIAGRRILSNAHVDEVERQDDGSFKVKVYNRGVIQANNVVYCTGAVIRDFVDAPVVTKHNHMVCTKMISSRTLRQFASGNIIFDDASHSMRVCDDRIFFGRSSLKGVSRVQDGTFSRSSYNKVHAFAYTHFPSLKSGLEYVWSYHLSHSTTGCPFIGPIPDRPNEFISAGFGDYDIALAFSAGAMVRDFVLREDMGLQIMDLFSPL